jgi:hypothetical protein
MANAFSQSEFDLECEPQTTRPGEAATSEKNLEVLKWPATKTANSKKTPRRLGLL